MQNEQFRKYAHQLVDWMADYQDNILNYPVKSQVAPQDIIKQLPLSAPQEGETFADIFADFENIILPGITHWQHPKFFAYFPANNSPPSILAEMLMATLGVQGMSWETSPAATELEERVMQWLVELLGLPKEFTGVIQDSASVSTLCSLLSAREKFTNHDINANGFYGNKPFTLYCSAEAHSSIEKGLKIAGFGSAYLRKIPVDEQFAMQPQALAAAIEKDIQAGLQPLWVCAALGTTGSTAIDPIDAISAITQKYKLWLHIDAAYAGAALVLPEMRHFAKGVEHADSFVFNPHKWFFTNFDCSTYFVKDKETLVRTFEILPEYLKTQQTTVNNYRDWSVGLGRRFRALKLWFVIRSYGVNNLQKMLRQHLQLAKQIANTIARDPDFEIVAPVLLNNICFRYHPQNIQDENELNTLNAKLLAAINKTGEAYLTHTKLNNQYVIRWVIGQLNVTEDYVNAAWELIKKLSLKI